MLSNRKQSLHPFSLCVSDWKRHLHSRVSYWQQWGVGEPWGALGGSETVTQLPGGIKRRILNGDKRQTGDRQEGWEVRGQTEVRQRSDRGQATFRAAREHGGTPLSYFPEMIPQANGDHVIAPTPSEKGQSIRLTGASPRWGSCWLDPLQRHGGGDGGYTSPHLFCGITLATVLPPSPAGTCDTRPARRLVGSGWTALLQSMPPTGHKRDCRWTRRYNDMKLFIIIMSKKVNLYYFNPKNLNNASKPTELPFVILSLKGWTFIKKITCGSYDLKMSSISRCHTDMRPIALLCLTPPCMPMPDSP